MKELIEKYKLSISVVIGLLLSLGVGYIWWQNKQATQESKTAQNRETTQLLVQQVERRVLESMGALQNLKHRLEITKGGYFDHWEEDAAQIIQRNPSFKLVEWIDSSMVVQMVYPFDENKKAVGLDISNIEYRRDDWLRARNDSILNLTPWMLLVQGDLAFLVDAPVYVGNEFWGTITAAMDFTQQFDAIFQGLDQYYIVLKDENDRVFYQHGQDDRSAGFTDALEARISFEEAGINTGY